MSSKPLQIPSERFCELSWHDTTSRSCQSKPKHGLTATLGEALNSKHGFIMENLMVFLLNILKTKIYLLSRYLPRIDRISSSVYRPVYGGLVFVSLVCALEAENSTISLHPSSSTAIINGTNITSSTKSLQAINSTQVVVNTTVISSSTINRTIVGSDMTSSPQIEVSNTTASSLYSGVTSIVPNATSSVIVMPSPSTNVTQFSSNVAPLTNSSLFVNTTMTTPSSSLYDNVTSTIAGFISSVTKLPNNSSISTNSTVFMNKTMALVHIASTPYINATTMYIPAPLSSTTNATYVSSVTMLPSNASITRSTVFINATVASINVTSTSYINATLTAIVMSSTVSSNASSVFIVLPSTPWPSSQTANYSSTYWNTSTWTHNLTVTPTWYHNLTVTPSLNITVNRTDVLITPNSTMMTINASSSAQLPGPTPEPEQGIITMAVNVEIMNEKFTPTLQDKNSSDYQNLSSRVTKTFGNMFSTYHDFISVGVEKFSKGSVIVDMKVNFNSTSNATTSQVQSTITAHNATNNTENFIFSQKLYVKDQCTASYCVNGGPCQTNATVRAFCKCPTGYTGTRCDKVVVNGNYSNWSDFSECSKSCKGGKTHRTRTCTNPPPKNGGQDCSSLGPDYEEKDCNSDVVCPVIWIIIGVCCAVFLLLLLLLIICCIKRKKKQQKSSTNATSSSQMNIVPLEIMVYEDNLPARVSPDGTSNPEFVNKHETEEDDIYKTQLLLFLKQSHLIKPGMNLSFGDNMSDTSDYSNANSRKASAMSTGSDEVDQNKSPKQTSVL